MQMTVVEVVHMSIVVHSRVTASGGVHMVVSVVDRTLQAKNTVVIAVAIVCMVEDTVNKVIKMVTMGYLGMTTGVSVDVAATAVLGSRARSRVFVSHTNNMLIVVAIVGAVEVVIVQVSNMSIMFHSNMAAVGTVLV